jgi:hypothetical protein
MVKHPGVRMTLTVFLRSESRGVACEAVLQHPQGMDDDKLTPEIVEGLVNSLIEATSKKMHASDMRPMTEAEITDYLCSRNEDDGYTKVEPSRSRFDA